MTKIFSKTLGKNIEVIGYDKKINDPYERTVFVINDVSLQEIAVEEKITIDLDGPTFIKDDSRYVVKATAEKNGCRAVRFGESTPETLYTEIARRNPVTMASLRAETRAIKDVLQFDGEFEVYARCELGELNPLAPDEIEEVKAQKKRPDLGDLVKGLELEAPVPATPAEEKQEASGGIHVSEAAAPESNGIEAPVPEPIMDAVQELTGEAVPEKPAAQTTAAESHGAYIIKFGKHAGKSVAELVIEEPKWVQWALSDEVIGKYKAQPDFAEALPHIKACYEKMQAKERDYGSKDAS